MCERHNIKDHAEAAAGGMTAAPPAHSSFAPSPAPVGGLGGASGAGDSCRNSPGDPSRGIAPCLDLDLDLDLCLGPAPCGCTLRRPAPYSLAQRDQWPGSAPALDSVFLLDPS